MGLTNHKSDIDRLRNKAEWNSQFEDAGSTKTERLTYLLCADLLELHDETGLSLDNWPAARELIEHLTGNEIRENNV